MGSFLGHALPGLMLIILSSWWILQLFRRYFLSRIKMNSIPFLSTLFFPVCIKNRWIHVDAYIVLLSICAGLFGELGVATLRNHHIVGGNMQHMTMYFVLALPLFPTLILQKLKIFSRSTCEEFSYILMALALLSQGLMFKFHSLGTTGTTVLLHTLLVYTLFASSIITLLELKHRNNILLPLTRTFLTLHLGTWFWQLAFILYPPGNGLLNSKEISDKPGDHQHIMLMACSFIWHLIVNVTIITVCGICIGKYYKARGDVKEESFTAAHYSLLEHNETQENSI